ncbi:hypothetical protein Clacol_008071 [Clathrus columnatus]|uniref:Uncharacterized protein n=1 Tax=Clathrus columnatus TaxID=1419009 RepID=A0AAV5AGQ2_9AGAM|nr:hypothetical protein Clacol_008071 [Clathrus columnatus]
MSAQKVQGHPIVVQVQDKANFYLNQLDKELSKYSALNQLEQRTQVPKTYAVLGTVTLLVLLLFINSLALFVSSLLGFVLPAYQSFKALESPQHQDDLQWLTYWVVYGFFTFLESFALSPLLYYLPFYFPMKAAFILWLQLPAFRGATKLYLSVLRPVLLNGNNRVVATTTTTTASADELRSKSSHLPPPPPHVYLPLPLPFLTSLLTMNDSPIYNSEKHHKQDEEIGASDESYEQTHDGDHVPHYQPVIYERPKGLKGVYQHPTTQVCLLGLTCFMCPGLYNALNGLGLSGQVDGGISANANAAIYATFAFASFFAGSVNNKLGSKRTLILGSLAYPLFIGSYLALNIHPGAGSFVIATGAVLGVCAGLLWSAQGSLMLAYPVGSSSSLRHILDYDTNSQYTRESVNHEPKMDFQDPKYPPRLCLYILCGLLDAMWQTAAYWMMGAMSNDPAKLAYFTGFYKSLQSAGAAGIWRADAVGLPFMSIFASTWALLVAGLIFALPMLYLRVHDTTPFEDEVLARMDDNGHVQSISDYHTRSITDPDFVVRDQGHGTLPHQLQHRHASGRSTQSRRSAYFHRHGEREGRRSENDEKSLDLDLDADLDVEAEGKVHTDTNEDDIGIRKGGRREQQWRIQYRDEIEQLKVEQLQEWLESESGDEWSNPPPHQRYQASEGRQANQTRQQAVSQPHHRSSLHQLQRQQSLQGQQQLSIPPSSPIARRLHSDSPQGRYWDERRFERKPLDQESDRDDENGEQTYQEEASRRRR